MIRNNLKPNKITDIVFRMDEYLEEMRKMEKAGVIKFVDYLENYIREYFANKNLDESELKKALVEMVDGIYVKLMSINKRDIHIDGYFGIILNRLFWELAQKNILALYILDNTIRDDRFKLLIELFGPAHFSTVYPYVVENINYSTEYTKFPIREYREIEKQINEDIKQKKHILYVEKDDSVNYLNEILTLGEKLQNIYICIFRNQAIDSHKGAIWLTGSFGNILHL